MLLDSSRSRYRRMTMLENEGGHLRVLIANERRDRLELLGAGAARSGGG